VVLLELAETQRWRRHYYVVIRGLSIRMVTLGGSAIALEESPVENTRLSVAGLTKLQCAQLGFGSVSRADDPVERGLDFCKSNTLCQKKIDAK
jgi:hypothetical protein